MAKEFDDLRHGAKIMQAVSAGDYQNAKDDILKVPSHLAFAIHKWV